MHRTTKEQADTRHLFAANGRGWLWLCACLLLFAVLAWSAPGGPAKAVSASAAPQPTPVRVADAACRQCHAAIVDRYLRTTKANGSGVASDGLIAGSFAHQASGADYRIASGDDGPTLSYAVPSAAVRGKQRLLYYLGSGNLGRTYLYSDDGYLLESPVAYFSSFKGYGMAPGLAGVTSMPGALPMNARCMRCHMSDVQTPLAGTGNHFAGMPFLHGGITCEQCHGDTAGHVQSRGKQPLLKLATLSAAPRDSLCISCHLEGDTSVELHGKSVFDYRPGQDIRQYLTYFIDPSNSGRSVTEVEQLSQSKCKRASGDHMSCMSCHDPHSRPEPAERVAYYRGKCLACHTGAAFAQTHHPENPDCTACHMPKSEVRDTPHVAWTDHRILRVPGSATAGPAAAPGTLNPVLSGSTVGARELGLAYYNLLLKGESQWAIPAFQNLQKAAKEDASDAVVENALASLYQQHGQYDEAKRLYQQARQNHSTDVAVASNLAILLARQGDLVSAEDLWSQSFQEAQDQEALGINLATAECMQGKAAAARATLGTVLRFNPASLRAKQQLQAVQGGGCSARP